jgi:hypothetical protein
MHLACLLPVCLPSLTCDRPPSGNRCGSLVNPLFPRTLKSSTMEQRRCAQTWTGLRRERVLSVKRDRLPTDAPWFVCVGRRWRLPQRACAGDCSGRHRCRELPCAARRARGDSATAGGDGQHAAPARTAPYRHRVRTGQWRRRGRVAAKAVAVAALRSRSPGEGPKDANGGRHEPGETAKGCLASLRASAHTRTL